MLCCCIAIVAICYRKDCKIVRILHAILVWVVMSHHDILQADRTVCEYSAFQAYVTHTTMMLG